MYMMEDICNEGEAARRFPLAVCEELSVSAFPLAGSDKVARDADCRFSVSLPVKSGKI